MEGDFKKKDDQGIIPRSVEKLFDKKCINI